MGFQFPASNPSVHFHTTVCELPLFCHQGLTPMRMQQLISKHSSRARIALQIRKSTVTWPAPQIQETSRWCLTPWPTSSSPTTSEGVACTEHACAPCDVLPLCPLFSPALPVLLPPPTFLFLWHCCGNDDDDGDDDDDSADYLKKKKNSTRYILIMRII